MMRMILPHGPNPAGRDRPGLASSRALLKDIDWESK
jgi:hypothetical protein